MLTKQILCIYCTFVMLVFNVGESLGKDFSTIEFMNPVQSPQEVSKYYCVNDTYTTSNTTTESSDSYFDNYSEFDEVLISDPFESWNRICFRFNNFLYLTIAKPLYSGYAMVTPQYFREGLSNFLYNLQASIRVVNSILQGRFAQAWVEFGRFFVNMTVGLGGFINVAKKDEPRVPVDIDTEDFGSTLAKWGVGEGFYIVFPVFGPSTVRDFFGSLGDIAMGPFFWLVEPIGILPCVDPGIAFIPPIPGTIGILYLQFNDLDNLLVIYENIIKTSVEPYYAVRDAYVKFRRDKKSSLFNIQP